MLANVKKRSQRRGWPIMGYVGPNGSGKSVAAVWDTLPSLLAGRPVLSTVRLLDFERPRECEGCDEPGHLIPTYEPVPVPEGMTVADWIRATQPEERRRLTGHRVHGAAHPLWIPFTDWQQLLDLKGADCLMDEVTGVGSSRESASMPAPVANTLVQMRRRDVVIRWTAPAWARADKIIRECSQAVTYCTGHMPKNSGDADRMWRQRRLYRWRTFDATVFEDFTAGKRDQLQTMLVDWHWGPKSGVYDAYDTYDTVLSIGTVTEGGTCYRCGGRRRAPECSCPDYRDRRPERGGPRSRGRAAADESGEPVKVLGSHDCEAPATGVDL
jgi:hypothetical protein